MQFVMQYIYNAQFISHTVDNIRYLRYDSNRCNHAGMSNQLTSNNLTFTLNENW